MISGVDSADCWHCRPAWVCDRERVGEALAGQGDGVALRVREGRGRHRAGASDGEADKVQAKLEEEIAMFLISSSSVCKCNNKFCSGKELVKVTRKIQ